MTSQVKVWLSLLLFAVAAYGGFSLWRVYDAAAHKESREEFSSGTGSGVIERARPTGKLDDFDLVDTAGQPFSLDSLKGKVWLASFFFSSCPGPCAQMNRAIGSLQNEIPDKNLEFVSITVDPTNDTPERLAEYARTFRADPKRWFFLSAPFPDVQRLATDVFQVTVGRQVHTERVILVDKESKVRGLYMTNDPSQMISLKRRIAKLLAAEPGDSPASETEADEQPPAAKESATDATHEKSSSESLQSADEPAKGDGPAASGEPR